jgi:WD40 repeat protein
MTPQASCQVSCPTWISHLFITPRHVVAATCPGTVVILEIACNRHNLENDPHKKIIKAGTMYDVDWNGSFIVTGNEDGTARLWDAENG